MNPATAKIIDRLISSRDTLKRLDIGDYTLIREARDAMSEAASALDSYAKTFDLISKSDRQAAELARKEGC